MQVFVVGDIHGRLNALNEVLDKAHFDIDSDTLIVLGDVVDGGRQTRGVIERLLEIKNCILVIGNHDVWALHWMRTGIELPVWVHQGGLATMRSYDFYHKMVPQKHTKFLESGKPYYIDSSNRLYAHGGFDPETPIKHQEPEFIMWDRSLISYARGYWDTICTEFVEGRNVPGYDRVFVGHTTTQVITNDMNNTKPGIYNNLVAMDTGSGCNGKLSIMNVETMKYYQSKKQKP